MAQKYLNIGSNKNPTKITHIGKMLSGKGNVIGDATKTLSFKSSVSGVDTIGNSINNDFSVNSRSTPVLFNQYKIPVGSLIKPADSEEGIYYQITADLGGNANYAANVFALNLNYSGSEMNFNTTTSFTPNYSNAEGLNTVCYAPYCHTEGVGTIANYPGSHASGLKTITDSVYQTVIGQYNAPAPGTLLVIGDGFSENKRHNIIEIGQQDIKINGEISNIKIKNANVSNLKLGSGNISTNTLSLTIEGFYDSNNNKITDLYNANQESTYVRFTTNPYLTIGTILYNSIYDTYYTVTGKMLWAPDGGALYGSPYQYTLSGEFLYNLYVGGTLTISSSTNAGIISAGKNNNIYSNVDSAFTYGTNLVCKNTNNPSVYFGKYNIEYSLEDSRHNPLFVIGAGTSDSNRRNILEISNNNIDKYRINLNGTSTTDKILNIVGAITATTTTINNADYAEYFEWKDGNINKEVRLGYVVSLVENGKIVKAKSTDNVLGIVSSMPGVLGDAAENEWKNKYLTDIWGNPIIETITEPAEYEDAERKEYEKDENGNITEKIVKYKKLVKPETKYERMKINPDYDEEQVYIPRSQRPEWAAIGLLGKIKTLDDGTAKSGDYCKVSSIEDGILTKSDERTNIQVLKRIDKNIVEVFIK